VDGDRLFPWSILWNVFCARPEWTDKYSDLSRHTTISERTCRIRWVCCLLKWFIEFWTRFQRATFLLMCVSSTNVFAPFLSTILAFDSISLVHAIRRDDNSPKIVLNWFIYYLKSSHWPWPTMEMQPYHSESLIYSLNSCPPIRTSQTCVPWASLSHVDLGVWDSFKVCSSSFFALNSISISFIDDDERVTPLFVSNAVTELLLFSSSLLHLTVKA
jgi:hypothetical protein